MSNLPEPLTPADCNLKGYDFMPLDVSRLRGSELASQHTPEVCWAALLLWCASWEQVPAGSIPDNDEWLAKQAGYSVRGKIDRQWKKIRDGALHGWVKCSDGLLYHPVVAEKALEGWIGKLMSTLSGGVGNAKRWNTEFDPQPVKAQIIDSAGRLKAIAPLSRVLTQKQVIAIVSGSPPDSPPDEKHIAPRSPEVSPPESLGDRNREGEGDREGKGEVNLKNPIATASAVLAHADPLAPLAAADISKTLIGWERERGKAARGIMPSNQQVIDLAAMSVTAAEVSKAYEAAVADRMATNDPNPINAGFIRMFVEKHRNPPKPRPPRDNWHRTNEGIDRKGRELGMTARGAETYDAFRDRIFDEIRKREGQAA